MRKVIDMQMKFGEVDIAEIKFDLRSRDEIPKLLMGLQEIYCNRNVRNQVFAVLRDIIPKGVDPNNGRMGMDLWKILALGTLRLSCNWDYDKLYDHKIQLGLIDFRHLTYIMCNTLSWF